MPSPNEPTDRFTLSAAPSVEGHSRPGAEFIVGMAMMTALVALAIDTILPAMGQMAAELGAGGGNAQQWILICVFIGLAGGQLVFGPLSDQTGRKPAILLGLGLYVVGSAVCLWAPNFPLLLAGRVLQGFGAAGPRVVTMAMVRDSHQGPAMAKVMSMMTTVFIFVPIVAPSLGQGLLVWTGWRGIFALLLGAGVLAGAWLALRQPETLAPAQRVPMHVATVAQAVRQVLCHPVAARWNLMTALMFGAMVAYLGTSPQVIGELYGAQQAFGLYFALLASAVGLAGALNARWVQRVGLERLTRRALWAFNLLAWAMLVACALSGGRPPLVVWLGLMAGLLGCLGFLFGNGQALAMAPLAQQLGLSASVIGTVNTVVSALSGAAIGAAYNGTLWPLAGGFAMLGAGAAWAMQSARRHAAKAAPAARPRAP